MVDVFMRQKYNFRQHFLFEHEGSQNKLILSLLSFHLPVGSISTSVSNPHLQNEKEDIP